MRWLVLLGTVMLGGCASLPSPRVPSTQPTHPEAASFALNGRISITHLETRQSAGLRWTHQLQSDEILLLTPLGQTVARVYRGARQSTLDDDGKHYQADDVESLMEQVLGWHLPLSGLHHWVLGMADPETSAQIERDDKGQISVLRQDGWKVLYLRYAGSKPDSLPTRVQLIHADLQVLLLIDECEWNPQ